MFHAIGGLAAASFYIPFKKVRNWAWESYWLVNGVTSWLIIPWVVAFLTMSDPVGLLSAAPGKSIFWSFFFGMLWGVGGLTFGLSMRYLGMSLGYALALGFCAAFGTIIPPIFNQTFVDMLKTTSGLVTVAGVLVCLIGIAICGVAGVSKEKELSDEQKKVTIKEFNFSKGLWIAIFCGIMSACMAFAIAAGKPIADLAVEKGIDPLWQITPVYIVIFAGGLLVNLVWCIYLNIVNKTAGNYLDVSTPLVINYIFAALAGLTWYFQFMFYGMGTSKMPDHLDFSSWTLHMAFIIVFSNLWGILFKEWRGSSRKTHTLITAGIAVLILSTIIVGIGNKLGSP